jgi:hypothetical protein
MDQNVKQCIEKLSSGLDETYKEIETLKVKLGQERAEKLQWKRRFEQVQKRVQDMFAIGMEGNEFGEEDPAPLTEDDTVLQPKSKKSKKSADPVPRPPSRFKANFKCPDCLMVFMAQSLVSEYGHHRKAVHRTIK